MRFSYASRLSASRVLAVLGLLVAFAGLAGAQETKIVFMVLWRGETEVEEGFRAYVEAKGLPIEVEVVSLDRDLGRVPEVLERIEAADPDLVYTWGTPATLAIAGRDPDLPEGPGGFPPRITDRPIVFAMVSQPVSSGIVQAFGPTGRNVTGVSHVVPMETQVQAMQAYMPVSRVAVIYTPTEPNSLLAVERLAEVGEQQGVRVDTFEVPLDAEDEPRPEALPDLVAQAAATGAQFLYLGPDSFIGQYAQTVTDAALANGLPTFAATERTLASSDALYGLIAPYREVGELAARKVEQVLFEGAEVSGIPVEALPQFSYRVRIDVARRLGVFPALSLMDYAEVIDWDR